MRKTLMERWLMAGGKLRLFHALCVEFLKKPLPNFHKNKLHWFRQFGITGAKQTFVVFAQKIFDTNS
jgi:hypothetical protein